MVWKGLVNDFPLIGEWTIWRLGNGKSIRIGEDMWDGVGNTFKFSDYLVLVLCNNGIFYLWEVKYPGHDLTGWSEWILKKVLGLDGEKYVEWGC
jgi:hypothetical protein